jgi:MraZ protein
VFTGTEAKSIDTKGRLVIPSKFRRVADFNGEEGFFASPGPGPYLILFTAREFKRQATKVSHTARGDGDVFEDQRRFFPRTEFLPLDKQGRVILPPAHLRSAGLSSEVAILGMGNHIEIWDASRWESYERENLESQDQGLWRSFLAPD